MGRSSDSTLPSFASLLAEVREQNLLRGRASGRQGRAGGRAPSRPGLPEPDLRLEIRPVSDPPPATRSRRALLLPVALVAHATVVLAFIVVPLLMPEPLPVPTTSVKAFFVELASAPVPPPPPPPAPKAVATPRPETKKPTPETPAFTAPVNAPSEIKPEEGIDLGVAGGVPGGVEGGIPGGVVGGVVGGLPDAPPATKTYRVGGAIQEPKRLKHVEPVYSLLARKTRLEGIVILECTISTTGAVTQVKVLRGIPMLDEAAVEAVKQWVYTPTLLDGVPIPVVMTVTVSFSLRRAPTPQ